MKSHIIRARLEELPEELEEKALDYIESLLKESSGKAKKGKFRFDWEGGLSHLKDKYTSVELQHGALE